MATGTLNLTALNQRHAIRITQHAENFIVQHTGLATGGGAASGAIVVEGSADGITWVALEMLPVGGGAAVASLAAAGAVYVARIMEYMSVRMSVAGDLVAKISFDEVI